MHTLQVELWERAQASKREEERSDGAAGSVSKAVCCFYMQNKCHFSNDCEFSHDYADLVELGCTFGVGCRFGHCDKVMTPQEGDEVTNSAKANAVMKGDTQGILDRLLRPGGASCLVECSGPAFDDSDPLWDELATAIREPAEATGDGDLSTATRRRLGAEGRFWLVDEDLADEWLCLRAAELLPLLERQRERVRALRQEWVSYDVSDIVALWTEELRCGTLAYDFPEVDHSGEVDDVPDENLGEEARQFCVAVSRARRALAPVLEVPATAVAEESRQEARISAALTAVRGVRRYRDLVKVAEACGMKPGLQRKVHVGIGALALGADNAASGASSEALTEICRTLDRCLFINRAVRADAGSAGLDASGTAAHGSREKLCVGVRATVVNLSSASEAGLLGQACRVERFDEELSLWQVQMQDSGTRLLLAAEKLAPLAGAPQVASAAEDGRVAARSRSPRGGRGVAAAGKQAGCARAESLLQLTRAAAERGEFVLVHHVVCWYGADAELPRYDPGPWS